MNERKNLPEEILELRQDKRSSKQDNTSLNDILKGKDRSREAERKKLFQLIKNSKKNDKTLDEWANSLENELNGIKCGSAPATAQAMAET